VPANGFRPRLRAPSARAAALAAVVFGVIVLLYLAARLTPLFALRDLEVTGAPPAVRASVREAAEAFMGESLVALDREELRRRLEALPTVRSLQIDRAFPHTLRIVVAPERPLAVVRRGGQAWLVSDGGRVIRQVDPGTFSIRASIWTATETHLAPGATVEAANVRLALEALRRVPEDFPLRVQAARVQDEAVTLVLVGGTELRLGRRGALALKLAVAGRVLETLSAMELAELAYLDVAVPERPVGGTSLDSQVEGETMGGNVLQIGI